jgi:hypothetical protein
MKIKSKEEISLKKEKFLIEYCKKMGWNHNELTSTQMLTIINNNSYNS